MQLSKTKKEHRDANRLETDKVQLWTNGHPSTLSGLIKKERAVEMVENRKAYVITEQAIRRFEPEYFKIDMDSQVKTILIEENFRAIESQLYDYDVLFDVDIYEVRDKLVEPNFRFSLPELRYLRHLAKLARSDAQSEKTRPGNADNMSLVKVINSMSMFISGIEGTIEHYYPWIDLG